MEGAASVFSRRLLSWYDRHQRSLPWRAPAGIAAQIDPYLVLVSETMLQQTQVVTVVPYFQRFIARFSTVQSLAESDLQEVLLLWQGLGYYSRARNLKAAAEKIVNDFFGNVPATVPELLTLPGVGRYTAGAICSIAFQGRAPILDGNVIRVLCRLDCIIDDPRESAVRELLWARAGGILPRKRLGDFNSALMELGALICVPKCPQCLLCPVRQHCQAFAAGMQNQIPLPRKIRPVPVHRRYTFCIRHRRAYLIEQRPPTGRWAGMWQFVTSDIPPDEGSILLGAPDLVLRKIGDIHHRLTHRQYEFEVFAGETNAPLIPAADHRERKWVTLEKLATFPLPRPHLKIVELLKSVVDPTGAEK